MCISSLSHSKADTLALLLLQWSTSWNLPVIATHHLSVGIAAISVRVSAPPPPLPRCHHQPNTNHGNHSDNCSLRCFCSTTITMATTISDNAAIVWIPIMLSVHLANISAPSCFIWIPILLPAFWQVLVHPAALLWLPMILSPCGKY